MAATRYQLWPFFLACDFFWGRLGWVQYLRDPSATLRVTGLSVCHFDRAPLPPGPHNFVCLGPHNFVAWTAPKLCHLDRSERSSQLQGDPSAALRVTGLECVISTAVERSECRLQGDPSTALRVTGLGDQITLLGFKIPLGSMAIFRVFINAISLGVLESAKKSRFKTPTPCSAVIAPEYSPIISMISSLILICLHRAQYRHRHADYCRQYDQIAARQYCRYLAFKR